MFTFIQADVLAGAYSVHISGVSLGYFLGIDVSSPETCMAEIFIDTHFADRDPVSNKVAVLYTSDASPMCQWRPPEGWYNAGGDTFAVRVRVKNLGSSACKVNVTIYR